MGVIEPFKIEFKASIPKKSKILDIDNKIRVKISQI